MSSSEEVPLSTTENSCAARGARGGAMLGPAPAPGGLKLRDVRAFLSLARTACLRQPLPPAIGKLSPGQVSELARV